MFFFFTVDPEIFTNIGPIPTMGIVSSHPYQESPQPLNKPLLSKTDHARDDALVGVAQSFDNVMMFICLSEKALSFQINDVR